MQRFISNLRRLGQTISFALCRLNEIQFSAPWAQQRSRCG